MLKCSSCKTNSDAFKCVDELEAHIASEHFDCMPFECEKCRFSKFPTEFAIKRHFEEDHRMLEYYIRYKVSSQLSEKLSKIKNCVQQSCLLSGIDVPKNSSFTLLNSVYSSSNEDCTTNNQQASGSSNIRTLVQTPNNFEDNKNDEDVKEDVVKSRPEFSDSKSNNELENNLNQNTSAALAAFIRNANLNNDEFLNTGDSNNNKEGDGQFTEENFNNFYSKLLSCQNRDDYSNFSFDANSSGNEADSNDPQQQAQILLKHIESQISNQSDLGLLSNERKKRIQNIKKFGKTEKFKKRFYLPINLGSNNDALSLSMLPNATGSGDLSGTEFMDLKYNLGENNEQNFNSNLTLKINEIQCQQCKEMVTNRATSLNYHVNMKHLKFPLFICKGCDKKFLWQRTTIVTHVQRYHNGNESLIMDNSTQYMTLINLRRKAFFPPKFALATAAAAAKAANINSGSSCNNEICINNTNAENVSTEKNNLTPNNNDELNYEDECNDNLVRDENNECYSLDEEDGLGDIDLLTDNLLIENEDATSKKNGIKLKCSECQKMILANKQWILLNHINSEHLHLPLFECAACKQVFTKYLRSYVFIHVKKYHDGNLTLVIDNRPMFLECLQEKCYEFFKVRLND